MKNRALDALEDYIDYLINFNGVKTIRDLTREERTKLFYLVLISKNMYVDMIRHAAKLIKDEVAKANKFKQLAA